MSNREIKFRAWNGEKMITQFDGIANIDTFNTSSKKQLLVCIGGYSWGTANWGKDCILMQFTGLHDKNGKEIYEGDIIRIGHPDYGFMPTNSNSFARYEVEKEHNGCDYIAIRNDLKLNWGRLSKIAEMGWVCEVIGNRFENPSLCE